MLGLPSLRQVEAAQTLPTTPSPEIVNVETREPTKSEAAWSPVESEAQAASRAESGSVECAHRAAEFGFWHKGDLVRFCLQTLRNETGEIQILKFSRFASLIRDLMN